MAEITISDTDLQAVKGKVVLMTGTLRTET